MTLNHNTVYPKRYLLAEGDLARGWTFYGPFETSDKAWAWATDNMHVGTFFKIIDMNDVRDES